MHYVRRLTVLTALALAASVGIVPAQAAENEADSAEGLEMSAQLALEADDYRRAVDQYLEAAERSDDPEIAERATRTAFGLGFNAEALEAATRWAELDRDSEQAKAYVAQLHLRTGNLKAARDGFREIIEGGTEPPDQRLLSFLGIFAGEDPAAVDKLVRMLAEPYRDSAAVIENSDLDYTIVRPVWFTQDDEVVYQITQKGEPFKGHDVSLNSLSDLIVKLSLTAGMESRHSLGVSRG